MLSRSFINSTALKTAVLSVVVFAVLAARFSPNWLAFAATAREAKAEAVLPGDIAAIERQAIYNGYSSRAYYVLLQARDLSAEIADPTHKIVRWRLLMPALGHFLRLPNWLILGLAHLGCLALIVWLVRRAVVESTPARVGWLESACLAVIGGATAPFFASMGLLGYYDAWLAVAFLSVAYAPRTWAVVLACLLGPWIDERFVLGLPLALCVRRYATSVSGESLWVWCRKQAAVPLALTFGYAVLRLQLGGSGGSQTVGEYWSQFIKHAERPLTQYLRGAWEGLRFGWLFLLAAVIHVFRGSPKIGRLEAVSFAVLIALTIATGLLTALDMSRSMVLVLAGVPLGWSAARRMGWHNTWFLATLAAAALVVPARHVIATWAPPVSCWWRPSTPLLSAQFGLGYMYSAGSGVPLDREKGVKWLQKSADLGFVFSQNMLGDLYRLGRGVPQDDKEAAKWYRAAAMQHFPPAQNKLGLMYEAGQGVPKDELAGQRWLLRAASAGFPEAQYNLGDLYMSSDKDPRRQAEALTWYRLAAEQGLAVAQNTLGSLYATGRGVPPDAVTAYEWFLLASQQGLQVATKNLEIVKARLTPEQVALATRRAAMRQQRGRPSRDTSVFEGPYVGAP